MAQNADFIVGATAAAAAAAFLGSAGGGSAFESLLETALDVLAGVVVRNLRIGRPALDVHHHLTLARGRVDESLSK